MHGGFPFVARTIRSPPPADEHASSGSSFDLCPGQWGLQSFIKVKSNRERYSHPENYVSGERRRILDEIGPATGSAA